ASLLWMMARLPQATPLFEPAPALGPSVPAHPADEIPWWQRPGSKGDLLTYTALALVTFGVLAHDLVVDFRYFTRLFIYYYNRATPFTYQPFILLQLLFLPIGVVIGTLLLTRAVRGVQVVLLGAGAVVVAC